MSAPTDHDSGDHGGRDWSRLTRRTVLAGTAATLGARALPAGVVRPAAGQTITQSAVIPEVTRWPDANLAGFMIHVGGTTSPAEVRVAEDCDHESWPPDEILAYDATLINRKEGDTPEEETTLYVSGETEVPPGALFLVNTFVDCGSDFVGINVEQVGQFDVGEAGGTQATDYGPVADDEEDERPNTQANGSSDGGFGAVGPGFDLLAAVAGLLGGGALLRWRDT